MPAGRDRGCQHAPASARANARPSLASTPRSTSAPRTRSHRAVSRLKRRAAGASVGSLYRQFTSKPIADAHKTSEVLICVSADSRDGVDSMVGRAASAGGKADPGPKQDYGFMYGRSFEDPDGHHWEVMWMDMEAAQEAMSEAHPA